MHELAAKGIAGGGGQSAVGEGIAAITAAVILMNGLAKEPLMAGAHPFSSLIIMIHAK